MSRTTHLALLVVAIVAFLMGRQVQGGKEGRKSPHVAALELVFRTQEDAIRAAESDDWWFDTVEREWVVRRPFGPGIIDSRRLLDVSYRIKGKEVLDWSVDLATGVVQGPPKSAKKE